MTAYVAMPDAEAVAATRLRAADLGAPVFTDLPADQEAPAIVVRRTGGTPVVRQRLDAAEIQVDVWAPTKAEGHDLAQAARVALLEAEDTIITYTGGGANVHGVDDAMGLAWIADPMTQRDRYTFAVRLYLSST